VLHAALLAVATTAGAAALPPRPPDATYTYTITLAGDAVGSSNVAIDGTTPGAIVVKENASRSLQRFTATTTMRYDAATLLETGYSADFNLPNGSQHTDVTVKPGTVNVVVPPSAGVDIPADPSAPLELIGDNLTGSDVLIPAFLHATQVKIYTLAVLAGGRALVVKAGPGGTERPASVPATDASLSLAFAGLTEIYWYDPVTYLVHDIQIPAQRAEFRLTSTAVAGTAVATPAPPPAALPTPFPHFTSRDVSFSSKDGTVLAGTLTVPNRGRAPFAAVVLVHGSGAEDRDETIGPNPIFLQLSNALSNAGYAVLRYDKRGVGKSGGRNTLGTRDELLDDVTAAYNFTRAQSEVGAKRVYLLGHSEGGELVPTVAAHEASVAGIILMAPPALPLAQISLQQALAAVAPAQRPAMKAKELAALENIRHAHDAKDAWYRSSMDVDPVTDIARVRGPILILQGAADVQVLPADLPRLTKAARAANHDVTVRTFSGDNHLFEAIAPGVTQTPFVAVHQYLTVPARIDARVLDTLITWLARHSRD
jgi:pimeloyl-ACP methyl ester carboxylesterase